VPARVAGWRAVRRTDGAGQARGTPIPLGRWPFSGGQAHPRLIARCSTAELHGADSMEGVEPSTSEFTSSCASGSASTGRCGGRGTSVEPTTGHDRGDRKAAVRAVRRRAGAQTFVARNGRYGGIRTHHLAGFEPDASSSWATYRSSTTEQDRTASPRFGAPGRDPRAVVERPPRVTLPVLRGLQPRASPCW
jgi:hypothetical protein